MALITFPEGRFPMMIQRGATYRVPAIWKDSAGAIIPLAGLPARCEIRDPNDLTTVLFTLSTANNRIILANTDPNLTLYISDEDTALLTWTRGLQDFLIEFANGDKKRPWRGPAIVSPWTTENV